MHLLAVPWSVRRLPAIADQTFLKSPISRIIDILAVRMWRQHEQVNTSRPIDHPIGRIFVK